MWETNKAKHFSGPILFITAFYVDRVVLYSKSVIREFPTIRNWTHLLMKRRETAEIELGEFGGGYPREPIDVLLIQHKIQSDFVCGEASIVGHQQEPTADVPVEDASGEQYTKAFVQKANILATTMVELIAMVEMAPNHLCIQMKKNLDATQSLLGHKRYVGTSSVETTVQMQSFGTQTDDEFWDNPETMAKIDEIMNAITKRDEYINLELDGGPNWSLGLTQMEKDSYFSLRNDDAMDRVALFSEVTSSKQPKSIDPVGEREIQATVGVNLFGDGTGKTKLHCDEPMGKGKEKMHADEEVHDMVSMGMLGHGKRKDQLICDDPKGKWKKQCTEGISYARAPLTTREHIKLNDKVVVAEKHQMDIRNRDTMHKSDTLKSPYADRPVKISEKLSNIEKELWYWIFFNEEASSQEILFKSGDIIVKRHEMHSMSGKDQVNSNVLDAWSAIMNLKIFEVDGETGSWVSPILIEKFNQILDGEINKTQGLKVSKIDLFVFPIYEDEHYQLVCFNVKNFRKEVLDNKYPTGLISNLSVSVPILLTDYFYKYLMEKGLKTKAVGIQKSYLS